jgi:hypothetical protein
MNTESDGVKVEEVSQIQTLANPKIDYDKSLKNF